MHTHTHTAMHTAHVQTYTLYPYIHLDMHITHIHLDTQITHMPTHMSHTFVLLANCYWTRYDVVFPGVLVVKNSSANAGDIRDAGLIPGSWRCPGEGNGNPFQYSCLENPMDRVSLWATVHVVTKNQTWLRQWSTCADMTNTLTSKKCSFS